MLNLETKSEKKDLIHEESYVSGREVLTLHWITTLLKRREF